MFIDLLHRKIQKRYRQLGFKDGVFKNGRFSLHYYERSNPSGCDTLVLIHGLGTSSSTWVRLLPELDPTWNVLALDLPGFGFSTIDSGRPFAGLQEHVGAVSALIKEKLVRPCILLGHSLGGWIAAKFSVQEPGKVRHLILVDSAGILCDDTIEQGKAFQVNSIRDLKNLLNKVWLHYPWYFQPFYLAVLNDLRRRHVADFVQSIEKDDFLNDHLGQLNTKVTVIWGRQDKLISIKSIEILKRDIPDVEVHLVEQCGHVPQLEGSGEFSNLMRRILEREVSSANIPLVI